MLSLYKTIKIPNVDQVLIHSDDEDPSQFYMVPERPTIATDDDGNPLFTFILYARNVESLTPEDREIERAYISLTTQVAVSSQDEQRIRNYLRGMIGFNPKLSYPPVFIDGSVEFVTFNEDMVRYSTGSKQPSLVGSNLASFSQQFNQDGAEVFRQSVEQGAVPAIVNYSLVYLARIPAVSIHIYGNRRDFYEELKTHTIVTETRRKNGKLVYKKVWPEIGSLKEFRDTFHSLTIDIDSGDFQDDSDDDLAEQLEVMAFSILESNILPSFFETAFEPATEEQSSNKWLMEVESVAQGSVDVRINKRDVVKKRINPNARLATIMNPSEIVSSTIYVDTNQMFFQELDVTISANVNFLDDPVYALKVFIEYDQMDEVRNVRVRKAREFLFKSADTVARFRQIMAKRADGSPIDSYRYWSQIVYKDTGQTVRVPSSGIEETQERQLIISYERLGFKKVQISLGSMPDVVQSVQVKIRYPGSGHNFQQNFELTKLKPTAVYFIHTGHGGQPRNHFYQLTYVLSDGQKMEVAEKSDNGLTLTISDPFEQRITTRFLAQADFSVIDKVTVNAEYRDESNDFQQSHHAELISNGETSPWMFSLRDPEHNEFKYSEIISYTNGSVERKEALIRNLGETIIVGTGGVDTLEVQVDSGLVDWIKYQRVFVYLEYKDSPNNISEDKVLRMIEDGVDFVVWKVLLRDPSQKNFRYKIRYFGTDNADNFESVWQETDDPVLVLENPG